MTCGFSTVQYPPNNCKFHPSNTLCNLDLPLVYRKVPKFSNKRKLCCKKPKRPNIWVFRQKDANGIANSGDPDQTAPLGAV